MFIISVIAIKALGEVSDIFVKNRVSTSMRIDFKYSTGDNEMHESVYIHESNATAVQQKRLNRIPDSVRMNAEGKGIAFTAVSCEYVQLTNETGANYELNVGARLTNNDKVITITTKARAMTENVNADVKGMSLVEVALPSGFEFRNEEQMYKDLAPIGVKVLSEIKKNASLSANIIINCSFLFTES